MAVIVSAGADKVVYVWDLASGRCVRKLQAHTGDVRALAISPNGRLAVSGSHDHTVRVWDLSTGKCMRVLLGHTDVVWAVAISPDGRMALSASRDCSIRVWTVGTGLSRHVLLGHEDVVRTVAFSSDGALVASGSTDKTVRVWELSSGRCLHTFAGHTQPVSVAFAGDGSCVIAATNNKTVHIWDLTTGASVPNPHKCTDHVFLARLSPDGQHVVSASKHHFVRVWDLHNKHCQKVLEGHTSWLMNMAVSPDGFCAVSCSHDQTVKVWDLVSGRCLQTLRGHNSVVWAVAIWLDDEDVQTRHEEAKAQREIAERNEKAVAERKAHDEAAQSCDEERKRQRAEGCAEVRKAKIKMHELLGRATRVEAQTVLVAARDFLQRLEGLSLFMEAADIATELSGVDVALSSSDFDVTQLTSRCATENRVLRAKIAQHGQMDGTSVQTRDRIRNELLDAVTNYERQLLAWIALFDRRIAIQASLSPFFDDASDVVDGTMEVSDIPITLQTGWPIIILRITEYYASAVTKLAALDEGCQQWKREVTSVYDTLLKISSQLPLQTLESMVNTAQEHQQLVDQVKSETILIRSTLKQLNDQLCAYYGHIKLAMTSPTSMSREVAVAKLCDVRNHMHLLRTNEDIAARASRAKRSLTQTQSRLEQKQKELDRMTVDVKYEKDPMQRQKLRSKLIELTHEAECLNAKVRATHDLISLHEEMLNMEYPELLVASRDNDLLYGSVLRESLFDESASVRDYVIKNTLKPDKVFVAVDKHQRQCVLKKVVGARAFQKEVERVAALRHPLIVPVISIFPDLHDPKNVCFIKMPYFEAGNLRPWVSRMQSRIAEKETFDEHCDFQEVRRVLRQIVQALAHIHSKGVVHRDLKPDNVLVAINGRIALCDFGISSDITNEQYLTTTMAGTSGYIAPYLDWKQNPAALDMWSLGCMMLELLIPALQRILGSPSSLSNDINQLSDVDIGQVDWMKLSDFFSASYMKSFVRLCSQLLQQNATDSLSAHEVLLSDVFSTTQTHHERLAESRWNVLLEALARIRKPNKKPLVLRMSTLPRDDESTNVFCAELVDKLAAVVDMSVPFRVVDSKGCQIPLNEVMETFFSQIASPSYGLFTSSIMTPGSTRGESGQAYLPVADGRSTHLEVVGKLLAKCLIERIRVHLPLNSCCLEYLCGRHDRQWTVSETLAFLRESCSDTTYSSFLRRLQQHNIEQQQRRVSAIQNGSHHQKLIPEPKGTEAVCEVIRNKLVKDRHQALEHLRQGFRCGDLEQALGSISGKELQDLFFGNDFIDPSGIQQSIRFTDSNWSDKSKMTTIQSWLTKWVTTATEMNLRLFLLRCLGKCTFTRIPVIFVVQSDDDALHVSTSSSTLHLPNCCGNYEDFEHLLDEQLIQDLVDDTWCTKCHNSIPARSKSVHCADHHFECAPCVVAKVSRVLEGHAVRSVDDLEFVCTQRECAKKIDDNQVGEVVSKQDLATYRRICADTAPCCICFDDEPRCTGVSCRNDHFVCFDMLEGQLKSELVKVANNETLMDVERLVSSKGTIRCPAVSCSEGWSIDRLLPHLTLETRNQLLTCLVTYSRTEGEALEERRAAAERLARLRAEAELQMEERVRGFRRHIVEEILNLKCPHCRAVFVDYTACDALTCMSDGNPGYGCKRSFCAICLEPFPDSSATHRHLALAHGDYYNGTRANLFQHVHRERQTRLVQEFLQSIPDPDLRRRVHFAIQRDLQDLEIFIDA